MAHDPQFDGHGLLGGVALNPCEYGYKRSSCIDRNDQVGGRRETSKPSIVNNNHFGLSHLRKERSRFPWSDDLRSLST